MSFSRRRVQLALPVLVVAPLLVFSLTGSALGAPHGQGEGPRQEGGHATAYDGGPSRGGDDAGALSARAQEYASERIAPGSSVSAGALLAAREQAAAGGVV